MKIRRCIKENGITVNCNIRLTENEIWSAYKEQEHIFDIEDITKLLNELQEDSENGTIYGWRIAKITKRMIELMAIEKRRQQDEDSIGWYDAGVEAIRKVIENTEKGKNG